MVGLTQSAGLDLGTTLWFTGIYNLITGLVYDVPIPVQPMKTIAAVALSGNGLTIPEIMAAGIFVSATVLVLGATGLMGVANRLTPAAVVRGMQLGVGLQLAQRGFSNIWYATDPVSGKASTAMNSIFGVNGIFVGLFFVVFTLLGVYNVPRRARVRGAGADDDADVTSPPPPVGAKAGSSSPRSVDSIKDSALSSDVSADVDDGPDVEEGRRGPRGDGDGNGDGDGDGVDEDEEGAVVVAQTVPRSRLETLQDALESKVLRYVYIAGDKACEAVGETRDTRHLARSTSCCAGRNTPRSVSRPSPALPTHNPRNIPAALVIVVIGVILVFAFDPSIVSTLSMGPSTPQVVVPNAAEWKTGILRAGLPQLPLTTLNSVISVTHLSNEWFPDRYMRPGSIATSVGIMNLVGCWFGAFPSCHGAGGLAAQVRFGARWGTAPVLLGLFKILIALLFGSSLIGIFQAFSTSMLGAMLVFSGIELATVAKGQGGERGVCVMLLVAAVGLSTKNIAIGVLIGLVCAYILAVWDWLLDEAAATRWWWCLGRRGGTNQRTNQRTNEPTNQRTNEPTNEPQHD